MRSTIFANLPERCAMLTLVKLPPTQWSTALWALPRRPAPIAQPSPTPGDGHVSVFIDPYATRALQKALDARRRSPPVFESKPKALHRARQKLRSRKCCVISTVLVCLGVGMFVAMAVILWWYINPEPYKPYDPNDPTEIDVEP